MKTQHPRKHKTFVYHLYNVGPTSKTLGRRCINAIQMFCVIAFLSSQRVITSRNPTNRSIKYPTVIASGRATSAQWRFNVAEAGPALIQCSPLSRGVRNWIHLVIDCTTYLLEGVLGVGADPSPMSPVWLHARADYYKEWQSGSAGLLCPTAARKGGARWTTLKSEFFFKFTLLICLNFHPLEVVSRHRDPQPQVV